MSRVFTVSETVDAGIEEVWAALTDWERAPSWMTSVESVTTAGPTETGAKLGVRARGRDSESTIERCDPPAALTLVSNQGNVRAEYVYTLAAAGPSQTRISLDASCQTSGPMLAVAGPLLRFMIRRTDKGQMSALKSMVEGT